MSDTLSTEPTAPAETPASEPTPARPPVWRRLAKPVVGMAVLVLVILWSVGVFETRVPPGRVDVQPGLPVPANAQTLTVKSKSLAPRVDVVGTVESELKIDLSARIGATVKEVFVFAGSVVTNGQPLLTLDDRDIKEQVAAAAAQFQQAETELNRTRQLFDNKAATEQALTAAQALFAAARAQWERSRVMLTYAQVVSPIDGVVTERRIEAGDLANPGQVLLAVYEPTHMQLEVPVPVRLLGKLPVGRDVDVTLDRPAGTFQGRVRQIVSEVDPLSRTQIVKVHIDCTTPDLLPGTFGRLWVADEARDTLMIPTGAVYSVGQIELVQVVSDGRAIRRAVRTGPTHGPSVEILSGLAAGDTVLVNPIKED